MTNNILCLNNGAINATIRYEKDSYRLPVRYSSATEHLRYLGHYGTVGTVAKYGSVCVTFQPFLEYRPKSNLERGLGVHIDNIELTHGVKCKGLVHIIKTPPQPPP
jgi:hypothetical protein